jgi:hypothetical protein
MKLRSRPEILGETVYVIGFPLGLQKAVTQGIVSSVYSDAIQFDAPISSGNSGGPLLDAQGEVLGIVTLGSRASSAEVMQNFNIAIPSRVVPALAAFKYPPIGFLGAWLKLADLEADEVHLFTEHKIPELLQVAGDVFYKALGKDYVHGSSAKEVLAALIERFGLVRDNIAGQATSAANLLRSQTAKFDAIAALFSQNPLDQDLQSAVDLVQGSSRSATPSTVHDFPNLVKLGVADYKLRYAAAAYQLDFLALYLSALLNADYTTIREIRVQNAETESYELLPSASFPDLRSNRITLTEASLWFSRTGRIAIGTNFLDDFLRYYIVKAERELKAGNVKGAVDALKSNTTYRGYSDNALRAKILYAQSDFQGAMSAYRDAWLSDQFRYMLPFNPW